MRLAIVLVPAAAAVLAGCSSTVDGHPVGSGGSGSVPGSGGATPQLHELWKRSVGGPTGSERQLTVGDADASGVYVSDLSGHVVALDAKSGAPRWRARPGTRSGTGVGVAGNRVLYYDSNDGLFALDAATGKVVWHKDVSPSPLIKVRPAVAHGIIALPHDGVLSGVRLTTGAAVWNTPEEEKYYETGPVSDGKLIFDVGANPTGGTPRLVARRPTTGAVVWKAALGPRFEGFNNLYRLGGVVVVLRQPGQSSAEHVELDAFDAGSGRAAWHTELDGVSGTQIALATAGLGLFGSLKGLVGIDLRTGKTRFVTKIENIGPFDIGVCGRSPCGIGITRLGVLTADGSTAQELVTPGEGATKLFTGAEGSVYLEIEGTLYRYG